MFRAVRRTGVSPAKAGGAVAGWKDRGGPACWATPAGEGCPPPPAGAGCSRLFWGLFQYLACQGYVPSTGEMGFLSQFPCLALLFVTVIRLYPEPQPVAGGPHYLHYASANRDNDSDVPSCRGHARGCGYPGPLCLSLIWLSNFFHDKNHIIT